MSQNNPYPATTIPTSADSLNTLRVCRPGPIGVTLVQVADIYGFSRELLPAFLLSRSELCRACAIDRKPGWQLSAEKRMESSAWGHCTIYRESG